MATVNEPAVAALSVLRTDLLEAYTAVSTLLALTVLSGNKGSTDGFYATDFVNLMEERLERIKGDILLLTVFGDV